MKITFDTENVTRDCPLIGAGLATKAECEDCKYFEEMDGFDVVCSCQEPISVVEYEAQADIDLEMLAYDEASERAAIRSPYTEEEVCQETSIS